MDIYITIITTLTENFTLDCLGPLRAAIGPSVTPHHVKCAPRATLCPVPKNITSKWFITYNITW